MKALLDEANANGMGSVAHLAQTGVAQMNLIEETAIIMNSIDLAKLEGNGI